MGVELITLVKTNLETRGNGTEENPSRRITQYWTLDGELLFEIDPYKLLKERGVKNV